MDYAEAREIQRKAVFEGSRDERLFVCKDDLLFFALYYFPEYFTYQLADFHYDMIKDLQNLDDAVITELLWVMFREGAKTVWTKIDVLHDICFHLRNYITWDSLDVQNSEAALLDITNELQDNKLLIADFGQLYTETRSPYETKKKKKVSEFITANGIKVQAFTVRKSVRGRLFNKFRPDKAILDDFENEISIASPPLLLKIQKHIDAVKAGLAPNGVVIYLANLISEAGIVNSLITASHNNPLLRYRRVDVEKDGKPVWPDKYVMTDKEALLANRRRNPGQMPVISLETKRRSLNADGRKVYEVEMMNSPEAAGDVFFDRKKIKIAIARAEKLAPDEEISGMKFWNKFKPHHRYAVGTDSAEGIGRDSNTAVAIDFSPIPANVAASYKNNEISPDLFAYEAKRMGNAYGQCLIASERNNHGHTTIAKLKNIYPVGKLYRRSMGTKAIEVQSKDLGWDTNGATKPKMFFEFKTAFEDGQIEIDDVDILREMYSFSLKDLDIARQLNATRHFDLLTAAVIAWQMKKYADLEKQAEKATNYKQAPYQNKSTYEPDSAATSNIVFQNPDDPYAKYDQKVAVQQEDYYNGYEQPQSEIDPWGFNE